MFKILINSETSIFAKGDSERDLTMIRHKEFMVNDYFKFRGYMYTNAIYELLGVRWNPDWENLCRIYKDGDRINFKVSKSEKGYEVYID